MAKNLTDFSSVNKIGTDFILNPTVESSTHLAFAAKSSVAVSGAKTLSALGVG